MRSLVREFTCQRQATTSLAIKTEANLYTLQTSLMASLFEEERGEKTVILLYSQGTPAKLKHILIS